MTEHKLPKKKKRLLRILAGILFAILTLLIIVLLAVYIILTPARLTSIVNKCANEYLDAQVKLEHVELSLFKDWPAVSLDVAGGEIISHAFRNDSNHIRQESNGSDSLLRFDKLHISVNLHQILQNKLVINSIHISRPYIHAFVSSCGKANWDIFPSDGNDTVPPSTPLFIPEIQVKKIIIEKPGEVIYESRPDSLWAKIDLGRFDFTGNKSSYTIDILTSLSARMGELVYCRNLSLGIQGGIDWSMKKPEEITFRNLAFSVDSMPVTLDGTLIMGGKEIKSQLVCRAGQLSVPRLIRLVPKEMLPALQKINTDLSVDLKTTITGSYEFNKGTIPAFTIDCRVPKGHLYYGDTKLKLENFVLDASLKFTPQSPDSTYFILRKLDIQGTGIALQANGSVHNIPADPDVEYQTTGNIDLNTLSALYPPRDNIVTRGKISLDTRGKFLLSQLNIQHIGNTRIRGKISLNKLFIRIPNDSLALFVNNGVLRFGSTENRRDTTIEKGLEMLRMSARIDTAYFFYKRRIMINTSDARIRLQSAAEGLQKDTTRIHPLSGSISAGSFEMKGIDSTRIRIRKAHCGLRILPSKENARIPVLDLDIEAKRIMARSTIDRYSLTDGSIRIEATLTPKRGTNSRLAHYLDSLQQIYPGIPRDSLLRHAHPRKRKIVQDELADSDLDLKADSQIAEFIRKWQIQATVKARSGRFVTPYFPLRNRLENVNFHADMNEVGIHNTTLKSGRSNLTLNGHISNIRRVLLGRGALNIDIDLKSDTLDANELIRALNSGMSFAGSSEEKQQQMKDAADETELQALIEENNTDTVSRALVIPKNINLHIGLNVDYGEYANLKLFGLKGDLLARDRCLQLKELTAETDAGRMSMTALYANRGRNDITAGFDLEMHDIQVERLIQLVPSVDSLMPMLRSMEGEINCQIAATTEVDSLMNLKLPTLQAVCRIKGENLVLLDGETFTEISKMLHFKNKKRNLIDKVSVEMMVHDNELDMFPFILEMDRYKVAVGGVHKLDMSFNYHISVLKSPIPFKLGINISGTMDKMKFRLGKAKYKEKNIPSYVTLIDTTRINLKQSILNAFRRGTAAALKQAIPTKALPRDTLLLQEAEMLSASDSIQLIQSGIISTPEIIEEKEIKKKEPDKKEMVSDHKEPAILREEKNKK